MLRIIVIISFFIYSFFYSVGLNAQSVGGVTFGSALYCDSVNSGFISLTSYVGTILYWQYSLDAGSTWSNIGNIISMQSYNNVKQTTSYRAIVKNGSFPQDTSTVSTITVYIHGNTGNLIGGGLFCNSTGTGSITLNSYTGNILNWQYSINNGIVWNNITYSLSTLTYTNIMQNTLYRALLQPISGCPNDTSKNVSFFIDTLTVPGTILLGDTVCIGANNDTLKITGNTGSVTDWFSSINSGTTWNSMALSIPFYEYNNLTQKTLYKATVKNGVCATQTTVPITIDVYNYSPTDAGSNVTITQYETIHLNGVGNGIPSWSPTINLSNSTIFDPDASPIITTNYTLTLTNVHGCLSFDTVTINVIIPLPNTITPNGDGINDYFVIDKIKEYEQNSLSIFNRWGVLVYKISPYNNEWNGKSQNGKDLPDDIYYFLLDYGKGEKPLSNYILINR